MQKYIRNTLRSLSHPSRNLHNWCIIRILIFYADRDWPWPIFWHLSGLCTEGLHIRSNLMVNIFFFGFLTLIRVETERLLGKIFSVESFPKLYNYFNFYRKLQWILCTYLIFWFLKRSLLHPHKVSVVKCVSEKSTCISCCMSSYTLMVGITHKLNYSKW